MFSATNSNKELLALVIHLVTWKAFTLLWLYGGRCCSFYCSCQENISNFQHSWVCTSVLGLQDSTSIVSPAQVRDRLLITSSFQQCMIAKIHLATRSFMITEGATDPLLQTFPICREFNMHIVKTAELKIDPGSPVSTFPWHVCIDYWYIVLFCLVILNDWTLEMQLCTPLLKKYVQ